MNKKIQILRNKFKKYNIDGYIIPKNDDYFTEYSKINRLKIVSNFSGSAGLAVVLKNKNYLFTDGRYTIQSQIESGKNFKIMNYEKIFNSNLFNNLTLGIDPKLFTYDQIKKKFIKKSKIRFIDNNKSRMFIDNTTKKGYKLLHLHHNADYREEIDFTEPQRGYHYCFSIHENNEYIIQELKEKFKITSSSSATIYSNDFKTDWSKFVKTFEI